MLDRQNHIRSQRQGWSRLATPAISRLSHALGDALSAASLPAPALAPPPRPLSHRPGWQYRAPRPGAAAPATARRYRPSPRLQANGKGLALLELMIVVGTIMVVSGGIFAVYKVTDSRQRADREIRNAGEIADNIERVSAAFGDLMYYPAGCSEKACAQPITNDFLVSPQGRDEFPIVPERMIYGNQINSSWGGVVFDSVAVNAAAGRGVSVIYNNVPSASCASFVRGVENGFWGVRVNGDLDSGLTRENYVQIQGSALSNACGLREKAVIELIYAKTANTGLDPLSPCIAPPPVTQYIDGADESMVTPYTAAGTPEAAAGTPNTRTSYTCAVNQYGSLVQTQSTTRYRDTTIHRTGTQTRTTKRARTVTYTCPSPTGSPTATYSPYGPPGAPYGEWSTPPVYSPWGSPTSPYSDYGAPGAPLGSWVTSENNCSDCPSPVTETEQNPNNPFTHNSYTCAENYYGHYVHRYNQSRTRTRSYSCPAGTGTLPPASYTPWGDWVDSTIRIIDNCVACPAEEQETQYQWVGRSEACPSGQTGSHTWEQQEVRTYYQSWNCPAGTRTLPPAEDRFTPWVLTPNKRNEINTCSATATNCVVRRFPAVTRTWSSPGASCGPGNVDAGTYKHGEYAPARYVHSSRSGSAKYLCSNGSLSTTPHEAYCILH